MGWLALLISLLYLDSWFLCFDKPPPRPMQRLRLSAGHGHPRLHHRGRKKGCGNSGRWISIAGCDQKWKRAKTAPRQGCIRPLKS